MVADRVDRKWSILLFLLALTLYAPGLWWGLPEATAPDRFRPWGTDELAPLGAGAELYSVFVTRGPVFNPQYPLFHYFVQALAVGPYLLWLRLSGGIAQPATEFPFGLANPAASLAVMTLLARLPSLLMAAGVVVAAFHTGRILWDRRHGVIAAALVMLSYPMFYYSRTSNVDMGALFWTSLGMAVFAASLRDSLTVRRGVWLGAFAALATATKDPSYAPFLAAGLLLTWIHFRRGVRIGRAWQAPLAAVGCSAAVYVLASGLAFHFGRYGAHLNYVLRGSGVSGSKFYFSVPATPTGFAQLSVDTAGLLVDCLGLPAALLVLIGLVLCVRRGSSDASLALPAVALLLGVIVPVRFVLLRFVIVMAYLLAFLAARGIVTLMDGRGWRRWGQASLLIACAWPLLRGADLTYQMLNDSRYEAAQWFQRNSKPGDRVGYYGDASKLPRLPADVITAPMPGQISSPRVSGPLANRPEFVVVTPVESFDPVHEFTLPPAAYAALRDGSMGYQQLLGIQTRSLFARRPITFVNPPVKVFVRKDHLDKLADPRPRIEVAH